MDEHVHEWVFAETKRFKGPTAIFGCIVAVASCKHCGLEMGPTQMEARLNATERLSAEDATFAHAIIAEHTSMGVNHIVCKRLFSYTNILEGKDD